MEKKKQSRRGGARPNSGRPRKDPNIWGQVTCVLRRDTIQKLKDGCGGASKHFGQFLQDHLDEHPLPSRELYLHKQEIKAIRARAAAHPDRDRERRVRESERLIRQLKRQRRDQLRLEKSRAENPGWWATMDKVIADQKREKAKKEKTEAKAAREAARAAKAKAAA
jgi:hypothetical protein